MCHALSPFAWVRVVAVVGGDLKPGLSSNSALIFRAALASLARCLSQYGVCVRIKLHWTRDAGFCSLHQSRSLDVGGGETRTLTYCGIATISTFIAKC